MSTEQEKPIWKCAGCAHPPHGICLAGRGEVCRCLGQPENDVVCQHGTAADVHCCNCHSGFVFDHTKCACGSSNAASPAGAQGETPADYAALSMAHDWLNEAEEIARLREEVEYQVKEVRRMRLGWDRSHDLVKAERAQRIAAERVKLDAESQVQALQADNERLLAELQAEREITLNDPAEQRAERYAREAAEVTRKLIAAESQVQALQAQLECMVAPEERDQWRREAQRLAVERAYVQGVFLDAGVEVGPDLGDAARAMADLLSEAQQRIETLTAERDKLQRQVEDFEDQVSALYREMSELEERS